jgi:transcriptional regulator with XRE-family HTH domain
MLKEVAADLGVSIAIVSEWENGHRFPSIDHLQALTQYTGISASRFFKDMELDNDGESSLPRKGRAGDR